MKGEGAVMVTPGEDRGYRLAGLAVLLLGLGGLTVWGALAPIDSAVVASGQVQVESKRKTVQHLEGGQVGEIAVRDGDMVRRGDLLLRLDDTQLRAQLERVRWQYHNEQTILARLAAERDGDEEITFPAVAEGDFDRQELEKLQRQEARLLQYRRQRLEGELGVLRLEVEQLSEQIQGLKAVTELQRQRVAHFTQEIEEWQSLYQRKLGDKQRLQQAEHERLELEAEVVSAEAEMARLRIAMAETRARIELTEWEFMTGVLGEIRERQAALTEHRSQWVALADRVARTAIHAPESGVVVGMEIHTLGAVISQGSPILHIVPQSQEFVVDARIDSGEIDRVVAGQGADIRFSAFNSSRTPVIEGRLRQVSADTYSDEATGVPYYRATVEVTEPGLEQMREYGLELLSGMPAEVMIRTGARTALQYLLQPLTDLAARAFREE